MGALQVAKRIPAWRDDRGQVMVLMAGSMIALIGILGLVVDSGIILEQRRQLQNAVDAASLAAARAARDDPSHAVDAAEEYLLLNGFDPADVSLSISVDPTYAPDQVEVSITAQIPTAFFRLFNVNSKTVSVRAVGQAVELTAGSYAMVALNQTACDAFIVQGNPDVTLVGGGVMVNSDCPTYASGVSGSASLTADVIDHYAPGGFQISGSAWTTPAPTTQNSRISDPLSGLAVPTPGTSPDSGGTSGSPSVRHVNGSGSVTLQPGVYWGGLRISGGVDVTLRYRQELWVGAPG